MPSNLGATLTITHGSPCLRQRLRLFEQRAKSEPIVSPIVVAERRLQLRDEPLDGWIEDCGVIFVSKEFGEKLEFRSSQHRFLLPVVGTDSGRGLGGRAPSFLGRSAQKVD
jgi:hypothetical protein